MGIRKENPHQIEHVVDSRAAFVRTVERASRNGESADAINWRIYELPNTRIAVIHSPYQPLYNVLLQPRQLFGEGSYLKFQLNMDDFNAYEQGITRKSMNNRECLENISSAMVIAAKYSAGKSLTDHDPLKRDEASAAEVNSVLKILEAVQRMNSDKKLDRFKHQMKAERMIGRLFKHIREPLYPL
jgi:hypothetical protein